MNRVDMYKCAGCGRIYETEEEAEKCEDGHAMPEVIEKTHRWEKMGDKYTYPEYIWISMSNGKTGRYVLHGVEE